MNEGWGMEAQVVTKCYEYKDDITTNPSIFVLKSFISVLFSVIS